MYFKDKQNNLHFLSDSDIAAGGKSFLPADCVKISDTKANQIMASRIVVDPYMLSDKEYLASTDWYVIRQLETGVTIPEDVLTSRQKARENVK